VRSPETRAVFAVGSDCKLKELEDSVSGLVVTREFDTGANITQIAVGTGEAQ
jgi:hypothetical protein